MTATVRWFGVWRRRPADRTRSMTLTTPAASRMTSPAPYCVDVAERRVLVTGVRLSDDPLACRDAGDDRRAVVYPVVAAAVLMVEGNDDQGDVNRLDRERVVDGSIVTLDLPSGSQVTLSGKVSSTVTWY